MHATKTIVLLASAARTAAENGSAKSTLEKQDVVGPGAAYQRGFTRHMQVFFNVSAYTSGNSDLTIEGSLDGGTTWFTLTPSSAWVQVAGTGKQVRRYEGPIPPQIRAVLTGTCSFTAAVTALVGAEAA